MLAQDREGHWDVAHTAVKVPTEYDILMAMTNWRHSDLRSMDVLMSTVDASYGWTFWDQIKIQKKYAMFSLIIWQL